MNELVIEQLNPLSGTMTERRAVLAFCCPSYTSGNFSTTNPTYTSATFLQYCPEFTQILTGADAPSSYLAIYNGLYDMANHCLDYKLFGQQWYILMSYYIAHYFIKALERLASINNIASNNYVEMIGALSSQQVGIVTKEDLGGENLSYDAMVSVGIYQNAGEYATTPYGRLFWTMYYPYGKIRKIGRYC